MILQANDIILGTIWMKNINGKTFIINKIDLKLVKM